MFSLNVSEATTQNMEKILNVMVCFFDDDVSKIVTQHLASRKVNVSNASALMRELKDVVQCSNVECKQVTSILFTIVPLQGKRLDLRHK